MKNNNKGFSLVELIVVIGMFTIVGAMLVSFVAISSRTYTKASAEVDIQEEAQLTLNQIKDLIIDTNRAVSYGLESPEDKPSRSFTVIKGTTNAKENLRQTWLDDGADPNLIKEVLVIYSEESRTTDVGGTLTTTYTYPVIKIVYDQYTGELFFAEQEFADVESIDISSFGTTSADMYLLSRYVTNFNIDLANIEDSQVDMQLDFSSDSQAGSGREYLATSTINLRNKVIVSENLAEIYTDPGVQINPYVESVKILKNNASVPGKSDVIQKGTDAITYTAEVEAHYGASEGVTWDLTSDNSGLVSTVSAVGVVNVPITEPSTSLTLTAYSTGDNLVKDSITINLIEGDYPVGITISVHDSGSIGDEDGVRRIYTCTATTSYSEGPDVTGGDITWTPPALPVGSTWYINDNKQLVISLLTDAGNAIYEVGVQANEVNAANQHVSDTETITVPDLTYVEIKDLVVEIEGAKVLSRGNSGVITLSAVIPSDVGDISDVTYTWEVEPLGLVTMIPDPDDPSKVEIKADTGLDWNEEYEILVNVTVERTVGDVYQKKTPKKPCEISINPVVLSIINHNTVDQWGHFTDSFNYQLSNVYLSDSERDALIFSVDFYGINLLDSSFNRETSYIYLDIFGVDPWDYYFTVKLDDNEVSTKIEHKKK